jgi:hypothetical protein
MVLRKTLGSKRNGVKKGAGDRILCSSMTRTPHQTSLRIMRWARHVARIGKRYMQGFLGKPGRNRPLGRSMCMWDDNIKIVV